LQRDRVLGAHRCRVVARACDARAVILARAKTYKSASAGCLDSKRASLALAQNCKPFGLPVKFEGAARLMLKLLQEVSRQLDLIRDNRLP
jgi:hypothetical protein